MSMPGHSLRRRSRKILGRTYMAGVSGARRATPDATLIEAADQVAAVDGAGNRRGRGRQGVSQQHGWVCGVRSYVSEPTRSAEPAWRIRGSWRQGPRLFNPNMRHAAALAAGATRCSCSGRRWGRLPEHMATSSELSTHIHAGISARWVHLRHVDARAALPVPEPAWRLGGGAAPLQPQHASSTSRATGPRGPRRQAWRCYVRRTTGRGPTRLEPSVRSTAYGHVNQLRDPAIFEEDGRVFLLYAVAGESGIAIAEVHLD